MPFHPVITRGDAAHALSTCGDHVVEGALHVEAQEHFYLETNACVAYPGEAGDIEVVAATQAPGLLQVDFSFGWGRGGAARLLGFYPPRLAPPPPPPYPTSHRSLLKKSRTKLMTNKYNNNNIDNDDDDDDDDGDNDADDDDADDDDIKTMMMMMRRRRITIIFTAEILTKP